MTAVRYKRLYFTRSLTDKWNQVRTTFAIFEGFFLGFLRILLDIQVKIAPRLLGLRKRAYNQNFGNFLNFQNFLKKHDFGQGGSLFEHETYIVNLKIEKSRFRG